MSSLLVDTLYSEYFFTDIFKKLNLIIMPTQKSLLLTLTLKKIVRKM